MQIEELFESEATDKADRLAANIAFIQLRLYLENRAEFPESFKWMTVDDSAALYIRASDLDLDEYRDLVIVLTAKGEAKQQADGAYYRSDGGLLRKGAHTYLFVSCLKGPGDPTYVDTRLSGSRSTFVHEFMHYLLGFRKKGGRPSGALMAAGDIQGYYNDPDETNAYYQEAVQGVLDVFKGIAQAGPHHLKKWQDQSTPDLVAWIKQSFLDKEFLQYASEKTVRALNKRLVRFVDGSLRPMLDSHAASST